MTSGVSAQPTSDHNYRRNPKSLSSGEVSNPEQRTLCKAALPGAHSVVRFTKGAQNRCARLRKTPT